MKTFGFSLNRLLGITSAKRKIAKVTGIPTTKQGRQRKVAMMGLRLITGRGKRSKWL